MMESLGSKWDCFSTIYPLRLEWQSQNICDCLQGKGPVGWNSCYIHGQNKLSKNPKVCLKLIFHFGSRIDRLIFQGVWVGVFFMVYCGTVRMKIEFPLSRTTAVGTSGGRVRYVEQRMTSSPSH